MKKWVILSLLVIFILACVMRILPLTQYAIWGSDSGEYYAITEQLTQDGYVSTEYDGWGFGYPYFPGMFYLTGAAHFLLGIDLLLSMIIVIPVVASLSVLITFFIAKRILKSDAAGIFAGAFVAVAMPQVFATSHPMPGSLGDVLLLSALLLFLASFKNRKFILLLVLNTLALTITHHLSGYFLFIMILGGLFATEILRNEGNRDTRFQWAYLVFLYTLLILYWNVFAPPFAEKIVGSAFDLPSWTVFSLGYAALFLMYVLIWIRRHKKWNYHPKFPKPQKQLMMYSSLLIVFFCVLVFLALFEMPGTNIKLSANTVFLFAPLVILLALTSVGSGYLRFFRHGMMVYGWIVALLLSTLVAFVTSNRVLLSYRHPQYFMPILALVMGLGLVMMYGVFCHDTKGFRKRLAVALVIVLLGLTALSAYPPKDIMGGFSEGTSEADMQAVYWAKHSLEEKATIASDHRMSSILFGFAHLNATWDKAYKTLHAPSYEDCRDEIENISTPSGKKPINYVLLDDDIKEGAALLQWENAEPMSLEAQQKFNKAPFVKLYEASGVEVYGIVE